jgi:NhaP-type Na+/H+ or K+/H+ antiporter
VLLVVDKYNFSGQNIIFTVTAITVLLSVLLHGVTAVPGANVYASTLEAIQDEQKHAEVKEAGGGITYPH